MGSRVVRAAADLVVLGSVTLLALARLAGTLSGGRQDSPLGTRAAFLSVGLAVLVAGLVSGWKRRTRPMPFAVVCVLAASLDILTRGSQIAATTAALVLLPLAVFAVAAYETRPALRRGVIAAALVLGFVLPILAGTGFLLAALMLATLSAGAAWGYGVRKQREYVAELVARTRIAERERELIAERAAQRERTRIAGDIHDVVSHSLAVVSVQAAGAERVFDSDPQLAREALGTIAATSRDALAQMRSLVSILREGPDIGIPDAVGSGGYLAQQGLGGIDELVAAMGTVADRVQLQRRGEVYELDAGRDVAAFRFVQEALTNAVKHGSANAPIVVLLRYQPDCLLLSVTSADAEAGVSERDQGPGGFGIDGLRQRLAVYGGSVQIVDAPGQFTISATLPRSSGPAASRWTLR